MNSKIYEEYNYWLGPNEDSNWNEYINEQVAHGVLGKFNAMDWQQLNEAILSKEEYWQERSATALGELRSPEAIEILKKLLDSTFSKVAVAAASELDWTEAVIEEKYSNKIQRIIDNLPDEEIDCYPELKNLLKKSQNQGS
ncbi:HEAT repeat domain-containing protein [Pseudomonas zeae]|jgi:HEAT repeat protein|uniref:HEAT repeat domain-containing protein n=1 Tax=Pseudomonas zeae TaxID=2745510 RepID=A0A9E6NKP5_9PSED|nr:HEAT repeat domain-containing protein [Pseudomonas zeae]QXI09873.1 HEAT repeat domain-containing protein [Pseudomonas zeae]